MGRVYRASGGLVIIILLAAANYHLFLDASPSALVYKQEKVMQGEWWRIITHPLVHVSWYHLVLDVGACLLLWRELELDSMIQRLLVVVMACATSLLFAVFFSPLIKDYGYCGLSGLAHGLMVYVGLSWLSSGYTERAVIKASVALVLIAFSGGKAVLEVVDGAVVFSQLHLGDFGVPLVHAHLGGAVGGALSFLILFLASSFKAEDRV